MTNAIVDDGKNVTYLRNNLRRTMDAPDVAETISTVKKLVSKLPSPMGSPANRQGLMLGLVQSGKTVALTTAIAMAADNGYTCFIVLTSDNLWLYGQTIDRLKADLPGLEIEGKDDWNLQESFMPYSLASSGLVLVATKNAQVLTNVSALLDRLKPLCGGNLPAAIIIDDEADQASLDTQASRRAKGATLDAGRINDLITKMRNRFITHTYLQVTATPQALFLQDMNTPYRPEFTVLVEPRKGYIGGNTFFSLLSGDTNRVIRY